MYKYEMDTFIVKSRYNTDRTFKLENETEMSIICENTLYYSISTQGTKEVSIDPDGGPNIYVGKKVKINEKEYKITGIINYRNIIRSDRLEIRVSCKEC